MSDLIARLITVAEEYFDCEHGREAAFFMIPQRGAEDIFVKYVTYAVRGEDLKAMEQWFIDEVLHPLTQKAGDMGRLYWRLRTCFEVSLDTEDGKYTLRTRLAVLDDDLNPVVPNAHFLPSRMLQEKR